MEKEENCPPGKVKYRYAYDQKGHLIEVVRNGSVLEKYVYDDAGRRVEDFRAPFDETRHFIYDYEGALIRVNDEYLEWTAKGQLKAIVSQGSRIEFEYGNDTKLDQVLLPTGSVIQYRYGNGIMPVMILENQAPALQFTWKIFVLYKAVLIFVNKLRIHLHPAMIKVQNRF